VKSTAPEDLIGLVHAATGATVLSPIATHRLLDAAGDRQRARNRLRGLTERETQVLASLGAGDSNLRIARRLNLSEATVKGYVSRLLVKLNCDNRTQTGLIAQRAGLRRLPP
jgi:DNA-binding NarL/FixJ family response regulator